MSSFKLKIDKMKNSKQLKECSLEDEQSIKEAFEVAFDHVRFEQYIFQNDSYHFTAKLVLFQGLCTLNHANCGVPSDYVDDTGVTVGGVNVTPRSSQTTKLQGAVKCAATIIKAHAEIRHDPSGQTRVVPLDDINPPAGDCNFWWSGGHVISENANLTKVDNPFDALTVTFNNCTPKK
jgi:hypothetical protein